MGLGEPQESPLTDSMTNTPGWAIELDGEPIDIGDLWFLPAPFDSWIEDYATDDGPNTINGRNNVVSSSADISRVTSCSTHFATVSLSGAAKTHPCCGSDI